MQPEQCKRSDTDHVRKFVAYAKATLNDAWYFPPFGDYRYMVALALYSKCITVAEATIVLIDADFPDEAFGMTRTLIDIFITMHYITNKDTDSRAQLYYQYFAKDIAEWAKIVTDYWPQQAHTLKPRILKAAANYPHPHRWSGKPTSQMALEPDTVEVDPATGQPVVHDFAYRVVYRWTSHYVHPTIGALDNHVVQAGHDNFVVRSGHAKDMRHMAVFNIAAYLCNTMVCFYRCMGDPQPSRLGTWSGALLAHLARRHK
jgi:Family of unknown function (DUF5677)